ncbi:MAG TPA: sigma factor-like helix-turn-helix DNA-binding protein [Phycisphaerales bacterium]|nr:sigma factor-like helix-turn-helix DNA-binding protein [Phycisphaerales bacterium]HRQ76443.1 sigma factor-like helix-turn-helix DNA-binding protein [Phycisphaerales bacterium]
MADLACHLDPSDRALINAIYRHGMSAAEFARAVHMTPANIRNRVRRIVRRMISPPFRYVLAHRSGWPRAMRRVAEAIFLEGRTQREAAAATGVSLHHVRQIHQRIITLCGANQALRHQAQTTDN